MLAPLMAVSLVWVSSHPAHPQVTLAEFQDYYSGLSGSVDTDDPAFVAMVSSVWPPLT